MIAIDLGMVDSSLATVGEIVGLVPSAALTQTAEYFLQLEGFTAGQILEQKLAE